MTNAIIATRPSAAGQHLNRIATVIFAALIAYCAICYLVVLASIPIYVQRVAGQTVPAVVQAGVPQVSNELIAAEAAARGMTFPTYAWYSVALNLLVAAVFLAAGALIVWKAQGDWFRWLTAFVLIFFPLGWMDDFLHVAGMYYAWLLLGSLLWPLFLLFLYLFPNGRAVPRWSRWPVAVLLGGHFALQLVGLLVTMTILPDRALQTALSFAFVILFAFVLILGCQIYRYRVVSTPAERVQIKWFVAGLAVLVVQSVITSLLTGTVLDSGHGYVSDLSNILSVAIPVSITISILRYRLWDIDVIIRKTLVYAVLTAVLALVYFGTVVALQTVFGALTGEQSPVVIVISTLVIAALFSTLRRRVQTIIDRRFFRQKYDAEQVLERFAQTARDEVELDALTAETVKIVNETMQPRQVSLWLRPRKESS